MAFHPYPQVIRILFNGNRFGPPAPVTAPSACPGVDHKVSRPPPRTVALFGPAFAPGARIHALALARDERLVGSLCKRHAVTPLGGSDRLQAHGFRYCFTPLPAVLFTFPSRYLSPIGLPGVLSLGGWCRQIRTGFLRPRPTQGPGRATRRFRVRGYHPLRRAFPGASATAEPSRSAGPTTPRAPRRPRFGLFPFRSPLLGESLLFSFPPAT